MLRRTALSAGLRVLHKGAWWALVRWHFYIFDKEATTRSVSVPYRADKGVQF